MTPEDCEGCQCFDGKDICEAMRKSYPFGNMIIPIPIASIKSCERFEWRDEE